jgi:hypothetical protein
MVAHLPFGQAQHQRPALTIAHNMKFGVQPTFGSPDTSESSPFFKRLDAVLWAFKWVASIINTSGGLVRVLRRSLLLLCYLCFERQRADVTQI